MDLERLASVECISGVASLWGQTHDEANYHHLITPGTDSALMVHCFPAYLVKVDHRENRIGNPLVLFSRFLHVDTESKERSSELPGKNRKRDPSPGVW